MRTTIDKPVRVSDLPSEFRGSLPPETIVRVSLEILRDENGFTPEKAEELREAIREFEAERDTLPSFGSAAELTAHLRTQSDKE